jgi:hypothetical protein
MDNFDLKKFLKESKALENLNPSFKALNENESLRNKIREMVIAELGGEGTIKVGSLVTIPKDEMDGKVVAVNGNEITVKTPFGNEKYNIKDVELLRGLNEKTDVDLTDPLFEDELEEAKKKKDEEVEDVDITDTEDISTEDLPTDEEAPVEDAPEATGGLEDIAADMKGTEGDLMDHLMKAFQIAKGMGNEKLETQVGNTLKFFVSEYIGGGEG